MVVSILLQLIGLFCFSLSMDKHIKAIFGKTKALNRFRYIKSFAWILLLASGGLVGTYPYVLSISIVVWLAALSMNIVLIAIFYHIKAVKRETVTRLSLDKKQLT